MAAEMNICSEEIGAGTIPWLLSAYEEAECRLEGLRDDLRKAKQCAPSPPEGQGLRVLRSTIRQLPRLQDDATSHDHAQSIGPRIPHMGFDDYKKLMELVRKSNDDDGNVLLNRSGKGLNPRLLADMGRIKQDISETLTSIAILESEILETLPRNNYEAIMKLDFISAVVANSESEDVDFVSYAIDQCVSILIQTEDERGWRFDEKKGVGNAVSIASKPRGGMLASILNLA